MKQNLKTTEDSDEKAMNQTEPNSKELIYKNIKDMYSYYSSKILAFISIVVQLYTINSSSTRLIN